MISHDFKGLTYLDNLSGLRNVDVFSQYLKQSVSTKCCDSLTWRRSDKSPKE